jgi:hypothetical protein
VILIKRAADKNGRIHEPNTKVDESLFTQRQLKRMESAGFIYIDDRVIPLEPFKGRIKIGIITGVWKRPEVFEMFAKGVKEIEHTKGIDIVCIVAGSEGEQSKSMVEKHGFTYIEVPNQPLSHKMNLTALEAKEQGCTHVMCVGSDDIITNPLLKEYIKQIRKGYDFIGVLDFYFYDLVSKSALYWGGYRDERKGHTCGAGRCISARLMDEWDWLPWAVQHSDFLDNTMEARIKRMPFHTHTFSVKEHGLFGLDIKSSTNMTPFALWDNTSYIDAQIIKEQFPYLFD